MPSQLCISNNENDQWNTQTWQSVHRSIGHCQYSGNFRNSTKVPMERQINGTSVGICCPKTLGIERIMVVYINGFFRFVCEPNFASFFRFFPFIYLIHAPYFLQIKIPICETITHYFFFNYHTHLSFVFVLVEKKFKVCIWFVYNQWKWCHYFQIISVYHQILKKNTNIIGKSTSFRIIGASSRIGSPYSQNEIEESGDQHQDHLSPQNFVQLHDWHSTGTLVLRKDTMSQIVNYYLVLDNDYVYLSDERTVMFTNWRILNSAHVCAKKNCVEGRSVSQYVSK